MDLVIFVEFSVITVMTYRFYTSFLSIITNTLLSSIMNTKIIKDCRLQS